MKNKTWLFQIDMQIWFSVLFYHIFKRIMLFSFFTFLIM